MAGLGFASILTLIGVPALYHTYLRKERVAENRTKKQTKLDRLRGHPIRKQSANANTPDDTEIEKSLAAE